MNNEENNVSDIEISLPKSIEVDKIIEFYKDKEIIDEDSAVCDETEDDEIHSQVYGLSQKSRLNLYRIISAAVSVMIIASSFVLAYLLPGNDEIVSTRQDELRNQKDYTSLKSRHDALKTEIENLKTSNKEKAKQVKQITDIDNTKAQLRTDITSKANELSALNKQIEEKNAVIAQLDIEIAQKAAPETILPPGKYIVGKNIAAGKYRITGSGTFTLSDSAGKSKINTTLGSTAQDVTLENNDIMKFTSRVKFSSLN